MYHRLIGLMRQHAGSTLTYRHGVDWSETHQLVADRTQTKHGSGGINPAHQFGNILGFKVREKGEPKDVTDLRGFFFFFSCFI